MRRALSVLFAGLVSCGQGAPDDLPDDPDGKGDAFDELARAGQVQVTSASAGAYLVEAMVSAPDGTLRLEVTAAERAASLRLAARAGDTVTVRYRDSLGGSRLMSFVEVAPGDQLRVAPWDLANPYHLELPPGKPLALEVVVPPGTEKVAVSCSPEKTLRATVAGPVVRFDEPADPYCENAGGKRAFVARLEKGSEVTWMWAKDLAAVDERVGMGMPPVPGEKVALHVDYPADLDLEISGEIFPLFDGMKRSSEFFRAQAPGVVESQVPRGLAEDVVASVQALDEELDTMVVETRFALGDLPRVDFHGLVGMRSVGGPEVGFTANGSLSITRAMQDEAVALDGTISRLILSGTTWIVVSPRPSFVLPALPMLGEIVPGKVAVQGTVYEGSPWQSYAGFRRDPTRRPDAGYTVRAVEQHPQLGL